MIVIARLRANLPRDSEAEKLVCTTFCTNDFTESLTMPWKKIPGDLRHKARNKGKVILNGKTIYLDGEYDSAESREHYDRIIAALLTKPDRPDVINVTIARLAILYIEHAATYYIEDGKQTSETHHIRAALKPLITLFASLPVSAFGPLKLKAVREAMIEKGWVRVTVNSQVSRINRMLCWAVENELVPPHVYQACVTVRNLQKGRCIVPEGEPVLPVTVDDVNATLPFLGWQVSAMVRVQLLSAMRPQEVRFMRECDIDRSDDTSWEYVPHRHKTEHHGKQRKIYIGPQAQDIVAEFFGDDAESYTFSPLQAWQEANQRRRDARVSPMTPSQAARAAVSDPKRKPRHGSCYTKDSYNRAIARACEGAGIESWSPNQLRHTAATTLRQQGSLDDARVVLGHSDARTSEIYAEKDFKAARELMRKFG